jgi:hypothetical protein
LLVLLESRRMERGQMDDGGAVPQILGAVAQIEHSYLAYRLS